MFRGLSERKDIFAAMFVSVAMALGASGSNAASVTYAFEAEGRGVASGTTIDGVFGYSDALAPRDDDAFTRLFDGNVFAMGELSDTGSSAFRGRNFNFSEIGILVMQNDSPIGDALSLNNAGFNSNAGIGFLVQLLGQTTTVFTSTDLPLDLPPLSVFSSADFTLNLDGEGRNSFTITSLALTDDVAAVPLPASMTFSLAGIAGLYLATRRRKSITAPKST